MINVSTAFKEAVRNGAKYEASVAITLSDGTVLTATTERIAEGGMEFEEATSAEDSFSIGETVIGKFTLGLNNRDGLYDLYDFVGAMVVPKIGVRLSDGTTEYVQRGYYIVDDPVYSDGVITLECLDRMSLLDYPYSDITTAYPATLGQIVRDICAFHNVPMASGQFDHDDYIVETRPEDDTLNCRGVLSYVVQIAGCYARFNANGALEIKWYDTEALESSEGLDGGRFDKYGAESYQTGDVADGGEFDDLGAESYVTGDNVDAGTFELHNRCHHIYSLSGLSVATDDVVITGVQVTAADGADADGETYLCGKEGYILSIEENPLISPGKAEAVAEYLGSRIVGMRFRPLSCIALDDPSIEAGDCAYVTDHRSNSYACYLTSVVFVVGDYMNLACNAKSPSANSAARYGAETKTIVKARKEIKKQLSAYDQAVQQLTNLITQSFGVFKTTELQEDGSSIYYLHNKPTLEESDTIWKMTGDAFAVSTDGGETWNAGLDADGNVVLNTLSAIGIKADWITAGLLQGIKIIAESGKIGGWDIGKYKIFGGDVTTGVAVVQQPTSYTTWTFAAGGATHSSYADCPFRVNNKGELYADKATIEGKIKASSGSIAGWEITEDRLSSSDPQFISELRADGSAYFNNTVTIGPHGCLIVEQYIDTDDVRTNTINATGKVTTDGRFHSKSGTNIFEEGATFGGTSAYSGYMLSVLGKAGIQSDLLVQGILIADTMRGPDGNTPVVVRTKEALFVKNYDGGAPQDVDCQTIICHGNSDGVGAIITGSVKVNGSVVHSSSQDWKEDVVEVDDVRDVILNSKIYNYHRKTSKPGTREYGLIIERECPEVLLDGDKTGVELYSMVSVLWHDHQRTLVEVDDLRKRVADLEAKLVEIERKF